MNMPCGVFDEELTTVAAAGGGEDGEDEEDDEVVTITPLSDTPVAAPVRVALDPGPRPKLALE